MPRGKKQGNSSAAEGGRKKRGGEKRTCALYLLFSSYAVEREGGGKSGSSAFSSPISSRGRKWNDREPLLFLLSERGKEGEKGSVRSFFRTKKRGTLLSLHYAGESEEILGSYSPVIQHRQGEKEKGKKYCHGRGNSPYLCSYAQGEGRPLESSSMPPRQ